ncbi:Ig-like domain-containing protein, partial [Streptosporangium canum]|uniref:Ig-like domain-containing protein n=1 Tax=Streptosporangium canum TaxID=324952 RepID=UPI00341C5822
MHTESSTTYASSDGKTLSTEFYTDPIRVKQAGVWQPVDTMLIADNGTIKPRATKARLTLSPGGGTELLTVASERAQSVVKVFAPEKLPAPKLSANRAEYANAYGPGVDLVVTATPTGFRQEVVIRQQPGRPLKLRVPLQLPSKLSYGKTASGKLFLRDSAAKGKQGTTEIPATLMVDASANLSVGEEGRVGKVDTAVENTAAGQVLVFDPDASFLADPGVTYPVTLIGTSSEWTELPAGNDTFVNNSAYQNGYANSGVQHIQAGKTDSGSVRWRSYIRFDEIPEDSPLRGGRVTNADLILWNIASNDCGTHVGSGITARRITQRWDVSTLTWSNQPTVTSVDANTEYGAYKPGCSRGYMNYEWDLIYNVDEIVQSWADGQPNYGFQLASGNESDLTNWRAYRSKELIPSGGAHGPKLIIGYEPAREILVAFESDAEVPEWPTYSEAVAMQADPRQITAPPIDNAQADELEGMRGAPYEVGPDLLQPLTGEPSDLTGVDPDAPDDMTPPVVVSVQPEAGAAAVPVNSHLSVTFSEPVWETQLSLKDQTGAQAPGATALSADRKVLTFTPAQTLTASARYIAELSEQTDQVGNTAEPYTWSFTTEQDTTPPQITAVAPADGATDVSAKTKVTATFSESVSDVQITIKDPSDAVVPGTVAIDGGNKVWTFVPGPQLSAETRYTVTASGAKDLGGNVMAPYSWSFTTAQPDTTPPTVTGTIPARDAAEVEVGAPIRVTFSEPVTNAEIAVKDPAGAAIAGTSAMESTTELRFTSAQPLAEETTYTVEMSGAKDGADNMMAAYLWSFRTGVIQPPANSPMVEYEYVSPTTDEAGEVTSTLTPTFGARLTDPDARTSTM